MTLVFHGNKKQLAALEGLAYRIADNNYMIERYGRTKVQIELSENHKTIMDLFAELDKMNVPFWVQNTVIFWSENWRQYKECYFVSAMKKKNIFFN